MSSYHQQNRDRYLDELKAFLRIPSISTDPNHKADVVRAAEFVAADLRASRMDNVRIIPMQGHHPLVYADWLNAPGKPTLLLYGHYDVQPPDPLDEWTTPPFEPTVRNDNIYARGAVDDKGQTMILLKAVEGFMRTNGRLPINIRVLCEGEEEVGGGHISEFVPQNSQTLAADAAVICDTEMFAPGLPTICTGLRGMVYGELVVEGARTDLHSGIYGGAAPNPIMAIAEILTALKDRTGRIQIPGFYDKVRPPSPEERAAWASLPFNQEEYLSHEIGSTALYGDPSLSVFERTWAQPTLEVHGIRGGFTGEGAKTVIPARALAKVSIRLVAEQTPAEAARQIQQAVASACPVGIRAEFRVIHTGDPSVIDPSHPFIQAAAKSMTEFFGRETVFIRSGGSIPIVGLFEKHLGVPSVLMGFGLPDDNLHAPNEKFHIPNYYRGIEAVARYFEMLGQAT
jgi:acetylornithine deacetylase/succinyl-diaminopimelate desuccinylase-like protein